MIRPYNEQDSEVVLDLWQRFDEVHIKEEPHMFRSPGPQERIARLEKYTGEKQCQEGSEPFFLVCDSGSRINGFICGVIRETPAAALLIPHKIVELHAIYVDPGFRSGRTSKNLVQTALSRAKNAGATSAVCHIWTFNKAAQKHITSLGFSVVSSKYEKKL